MTERGRSAVSRDQSRFQVGPSTLQWNGASLTIDFNEIGVPLPRALRGKVRVHPSALVSEAFPLATGGDHHWQPIAPLSRIEVDIYSNGLKWSGPGYFDHNRGSGPLEDTFQYWTWSRSEGADATTIFYDVKRRTEGPYGLALTFDRKGRIEPITPPAKASLATSLWGICRETRSDAGTGAAIIKTYEDTPFYARSVVSHHVKGVATKSFHEALSLDRFRSPIVQRMLPFRMPRRAG